MDSWATTLIGVIVTKWHRLMRQSICLLVLHCERFAHLMSIHKIAFTIRSYCKPRNVYYFIITFCYLLDDTKGIHHDNIHIYHVCNRPLFGAVGWKPVESVCLWQVGKKTIHGRWTCLGKLEFLQDKNDGVRCTGLFSEDLSFFYGVSACGCICYRNFLTWCQNQIRTHCDLDSTSNRMIHFLSCFFFRFFLLPSVFLLPWFVLIGLHTFSAWWNVYFSAMSIYVLTTLNPLFWLWCYGNYHQRLSRI